MTAHLEIEGLFSIRRPEIGEVRAVLADSRRTVLHYARKSRRGRNVGLRSDYRDSAIAEYARYRALKHYLESGRTVPDGWYSQCADDGAGA